MARSPAGQPPTRRHAPGVRRLKPRHFGLVARQPGPPSRPPCLGLDSAPQRSARGHGPLGGVERVLCRFVHGAAVGGGTGLRPRSARYGTTQLTHKAAPRHRDRDCCSTSMSTPDSVEHCLPCGRQLRERLSVSFLAFHAILPHRLPLALNERLGRLSDARARARPVGGCRRRARGAP